MTIWLILLAMLWFLFLSFDLFDPNSDANWNLGHNGIWLQHGWLGDDTWFNKYDKQDLKKKLRNPAAIRNLVKNVQDSNIEYLFPHLAPSTLSGHLLETDHNQTKRFLAETKGMQVLPWVGGVIGKQVFIEDRDWRQTFNDSILTLLDRYPTLAGIHINIEPWPSGNAILLELLGDLRKRLPHGKILSVAAYPPPTVWQPSLQIHWQQEYYKDIGEVTDQLVVMMYDTGISFSWVYKNLISRWTRDILRWANVKSILLGLPAYDDVGVGYHDPDVENLANGLVGVAKGLARFKMIPLAYEGICIYSEWEMDEREWQILKNEL